MQPIHPVQPLSIPPRLVVMRALTAPLLWLRRPAAWLEPEALMLRAQRATGLSDFGEPHPGEALQRLVSSLHAEAELTGLGSAIAREQLTLLLSSRLRGVEEQKTHPERMSTPAQNPVFIVGLHRTGTTLLQQLLSMHPYLRPLPAWLSITPSPVPTREEWDTQRSDRIDQTAKALKQWGWLSPHWAAKHDVGPLQPEEEAPLLFESFRSWTPIGNYPVPAYLDWALEQDPGPVYAWLNARLRVFQGDLPGERWLLKSPYHLAGLQALWSAFPDATLIHTHRDPAKCVPSLIDMLEQAWQVVSRTPRRPELVEAVVRFCEVSVTRAIEARKTHATQTVHDVHMQDLVSNPIATMEHLVDALGLPWPEDYETTLQRCLARTQKRTRPKGYDARAYGWTAAALRERLRAEMEAFSVAVES